MAISLENKYGTSAVNATQKNALPPYLDLVLGSIESEVGGYLPLTGGTLTGSLTLSSGEVNVNAGDIISGNSSNTQERGVKAHSAAGEIYLYAQGTSTGNRGIYTRDANGANGKTIFIVNSNNQAQFSRATFSQIGIIASAQHARMQFIPTMMDVPSDSNQPGSLRFSSNDSTTYTAPRFVFRAYSPKATADTGFLNYYEQYQLPACTAGKTGNNTYDIWTKKTMTYSLSGTTLTITAS